MMDKFSTLIVVIVSQMYAYIQIINIYTFIHNFLYVKYTSINTHSHTHQAEQFKWMLFFSLNFTIINWIKELLGMLRGLVKFPAGLRNSLSLFPPNYFNLVKNHWVLENVYASQCLFEWKFTLSGRCRPRMTHIFGMGAGQRPEGMDLEIFIISKNVRFRQRSSSGLQTATHSSLYT